MVKNKGINFKFSFVKKKTNTLAFLLEYLIGDTLQMFFYLFFFLKTHAFKDKLQQIVIKPSEVVVLCYIVEGCTFQW